MGALFYCDTVGDAAAYADMPAPDCILITHRHGDHYNADTLAEIGGTAPILTTPDVLEMMPDELKARTTAMSNGDSMDWKALKIDAIPAHNMTEGREKFHPKGRDNGYVLTLANFRIYISGDTEDVPEMRALEGIDLAFVCMNLPYTMTAVRDASWKSVRWLTTHSADDILECHIALCAAQRRPISPIDCPRALSGQSYARQDCSFGPIR